MRAIAIPLVAALVPMAACTGDLPGSGAALYRGNCATCHGTTGAGDGPMAAGLPVPPADLRQLAATNGGVFPTERVMATIYGYSGKDAIALMPEFGPLLDSPEVMWLTPDGREIATPSALVALADHVQTLQDE
jgi:mono/diheme cytochrome c family protein